MGMRRGGYGLAVWLLVMLVPVVGTAQDEDLDADAQAREEFQAATELFDAGDYEAAARRFRVAYELSNRPELLFNLYLANERIGNLDAAATYLEQFLEEGTPGEREDAMRERLARLHERQQAQQAEEQRRTDERERLQREADFSEGPKAAPWVIASVGGAFAIGGAVLLIVSASDIDSVENPEGEMPRWAEVSDAYDRAPMLSTTGVILIAVGGAAIAAGLVWGIAGGGDSESAEVAIGPGGAILRGAF